MGKEEIISFLRDYKKANGNKYHIVTLGIFGSMARGEVRPDSDVDIVIVLEKPRMFDMIGIKQDIEESLQRRVDIVRYRPGMNSHLKKRIDQDAVYV